MTAEDIDGEPATGRDEARGAAPETAPEAIAAAGLRAGSRWDKADAAAKHGPRGG